MTKRGVPIIVMNIEIKYSVDLKDYRDAYYYIMFYKSRNAFRVAVIVIAVSLLYGALWVNRLVPGYPAVLLVASAYLVWMFIRFAGVERQIRAYARSSDNLIGLEYRATFKGRSYRFEIPQKSIKISGDAKNILTRFESAGCFLLYVSAQDLFIIPKRALDDGEAAGIREFLGMG